MFRFSAESVIAWLTAVGMVIAACFYIYGIDAKASNAVSKDSFEAFKTEVLVKLTHIDDTVTGLEKHK